MKRKPPIDHGPQCTSCRFYKDQTETADEIRWGVCRRYPPVGVYVSDIETGQASDDAVWPPVHPDEWCGEWQAGQ
jgi:hypothetical protein